MFFNRRSTMWTANLTKLTKNNKIKMFIKVFVICMNVFGYTFGVYKKFTYMYLKMRANEGIFQFLDMLAEGVLSLSNIVNEITGVNSLGFFVRMIKYDQQLGKKSLNYNSKVLIFSIHFLAAVTGAINIYCMVNIDIKMGTYILYRSVQFICFNTAVLVYFWCSQKTKNYLEIFNSNIEKEWKHKKMEITIIEFYHPKINQKQYKSHDVATTGKVMTKKHHKICQVLDEINLKFKTAVTMSVVCITVTVLWSVTMVIKYGFQDAIGDIFGISKWMVIVSFSFVGVSVFVCFLNYYIIYSLYVN